MRPCDANFGRRLTLVVSLAAACAVAASASAQAADGASVPCGNSKVGSLDTGDVVADDGMAIAVPEPGVSVTGEEMLPNGDRELRVTTTPGGRVEVHGCGPDTDADADAATKGTTAAKGGGVCTDSAHTLYGYRWVLPFTWEFNSQDTPHGFSQRSAEAALLKATRAITSARSNCSLLDLIGAQATYSGRTGRKADMSTDHGVVTCSGSGDGVSVTDFGPLDGALARTCTWSTNAVGLDVATQSDMRFNTKYHWTTHPSSRHCRRAYSVRAVATHERGHTFGLGHVSEGKHGKLTMSTLLNGACEDSESTLGLGDVRGLQSLY
jgi:hypothetical protein